MGAQVQLLIVALLVPACAVYALWKIMPPSLRRPLAARLLRVPRWPAPLDAALRRAAQPASGCGCDGCDRGAGLPAAPAPAVQRIVIHRRPPGR